MAKLLSPKDIFFCSFSAIVVKYVLKLSPINKGSVSRFSSKSIDEGWPLFVGFIFIIVLMLAQVFLALLEFSIKRFLTWFFLLFLIRSIILFLIILYSMSISSLRFPSVFIYNLNSLSLLFIDLIIPGVIQGFACSLKSFLLSVFSGACLLIISVIVGHVC